MGHDWRSLVVLFVRFPGGHRRVRDFRDGHLHPPRDDRDARARSIALWRRRFGVWHVDTAAEKGCCRAARNPAVAGRVLFDEPRRGHLRTAHCGPLGTATVPEGPAVAVDRAAAAAISWRGLSLGRTIATPPPPANRATQALRRARRGLRDNFDRAGAHQRDGDAGHLVGDLADLGPGHALRTTPATCCAGCSGSTRASFFPW